MIWTSSRPITMSHSSRSMANLVPVERYEHRSRSRSRSRMVVERTEVKQGGDSRAGGGGGYMQVEISMAVETMLDDSARPPYRAPARIQYQPGRLNGQKQRERYHEHLEEQREYFDEHRQDSDEWISSGDGGRTRSHTDESYGSLLESSEKRMGTRSKSGSLREFLSDYENIVNGGGQGGQTSERTGTGESGYRSESAYEDITSRTRFEDSINPVYSLAPRSTSFSSPSITVRVPGDSTFTSETTITTTTAIKKVASGSKLVEDTSMPRVPSSPVPPLSSPPVETTSTSAKAGGVSALTQQFEMNTRKQWIDDSSSRPSNGTKWSPKGGPKPKELPQLLPTVEFKTTPSGGKYRKIDYEVIDATKSFNSEQQDSFGNQKEESPSAASSQKRFVSPTRQKEQISVYEYDSGQIRRRTEEMPTGRSVYEQETQRVVQDSTPRRREWTEETKTEVWSTSSKGVWQYDMKQSPEIGVTPPPPTPSQASGDAWSSSESRYHGGTSFDEKPITDLGSASSSTILVRRDQEGRILASETWDTKRKGASYSTASTLEKTRELDEEVAQKEDVRRQSPVWTVVKSTRYDESKEEEIEPPRKPEGREASPSHSSRAESHISRWEAERSSKSERSDNMTTRQKTPAASPAPPVSSPQPTKTTPTQFSSASKMTDYKGLDVDGTAKTTTTSAEYRASEKGSEPRPTSMEEISVSDYRSTISARPAFNRTIGPTMSSPVYGTMSSGGRILKTVTEIGSSSIHSGGLSPFGQNAASTIRDTREREKKEMSDLNDRLASYIEKVRFLEAQNRKLAADLDLLRGRWGKDSLSVRAMYEGELQEARKVINDTNNEREDLEKQIRKLMDELADYRRKYEDALRAHQVDRDRIDELLTKLSGLEAEINLLRRRISNLEEEVSRIKKDNMYFVNELNKARSDLDQETLNRIDFQNQVQTLLEEIDFMRRVHDQEISELQALASRDTTPENREYFKNELSSAIRDIRAEYDQICNINRTDMESWYKLKVQEIQTQSTRQNLEQGYAKEEVKRLRVQLSELRGKLADLEGRNSLLEKQTQELNYQLEDDQRSYEAALNDRDAQIRKMREECQALMLELQMLLDTKQTLDAEIAIYRKMLEGEENRAGLRQLVEQVVKTHGLSEVGETESLRVLKGETASRTSFQRSAKGNVSIQDAAPDGKYIVLENTHRSKEEAIGEWKLKRKIDGKREIVYTLPRDFILRPGKSVKIWARGQGMHSPPDQVVFDAEDSFGAGSNVQTILFNKEGEERATHIQRSSHTIS